LKTNELEKPESIREKMPVTGSCWKSAGCKKSCRKTFFQPAEVGLTVWGVIATLLIASIGYLLAICWFARPIKKLSSASQSFVQYIKMSEQGRFEDSWESRQKVRRRMNELETIRNRDELQGLARDFIRMGERMLIFFRKIEEHLTDKKK
jgi:HAMP domain-containing protein